MVFNSRVSVLNRSLIWSNRNDSLIIKMNDARLLIPVWFPICMCLRFVHMWSGLRAMLLGLSWMFFICSFKNIALFWLVFVLFMEARLKGSVMVFFSAIVFCLASFSNSHLWCPRCVAVLTHQDILSKQKKRCHQKNHATSWWFIDNRSEWMLDYWSLHDF